MRSLFAMHPTLPFRTGPPGTCSFIANGQPNVSILLLPQSLLGLALVPESKKHFCLVPRVSTFRFELWCPVLNKALLHSFSKVFHCL